MYPSEFNNRTVLAVAFRQRTIIYINDVYQYRVFCFCWAPTLHFYWSIERIDDVRLKNKWEKKTKEKNVKDRINHADWIQVLEIKLKYGNWWSLSRNHIKTLVSYIVKPKKGLTIIFIYINKTLFFFYALLYLY